MSVVVGVAFATLACGESVSAGASDRDATQRVEMLVDLDDFADRIEQEHIEIDRLVNECMTAQGFTYIPPDRGIEDTPVPMPDSATDRDHAEKWGYGELTALEAAQPWLRVMTIEDVKRQLDGLQAQSRGESGSYNLALYGSTQPSPGGFFEASDGGCLADAIAEVNESSDSLAAYDDRFEAAAKRFAADSRTVRLDAIWARCMTESGHDFSRPEDIREELMEISDHFYQRLPSVSWSIRDSGSGPVQIAPNPDLVAAFELDLAVEADRERELALVDIDCRTPIATEYLEIQQEYFAELSG